MYHETLKNVKDVYYSEMADNNAMVKYHADVTDGGGLSGVDTSVIKHECVKAIQQYKKPIIGNVTVKITGIPFAELVKNEKIGTDNIKNTEMYVKHSIKKEVNKQTNCEIINIIINSNDVILTFKAK